MLVLVSGATTTLNAIADDRFGVLVVPSARNDPEAVPLVPGRWAMDNGAYSGLDTAAFVNMLERYQPYQASQAYRGCLFVTAPDVVGDAGATRARWGFWSRLIRGVGFPPALVAQDGLTVGTTPWPELGALFIGGTTEFKVGAQAATLVAYAKARGLHVHMGRVNSRLRLRLALRWGVDSLDGSSRSMFPAIQMARDQRWMTEWERQPGLAL